MAARIAASHRSPGASESRSRQTSAPFSARVTASRLTTASSSRTYERKIVSMESRCHGSIAAHSRQLNVIDRVLKEVGHSGLPFFGRFQGGRQRDESRTI